VKAVLHQHEAQVLLASSLCHHSQYNFVVTYVHWINVSPSSSSQVLLFVQT
jgi:hypothetical protein